MSTLVNPVKPIVINANFETCYDFAPNRYYYYTVELKKPYDNYRIFTGKAWAHLYKYSHGEIQLEISDLIKPYMYSGQDLLKPEFDQATYTYGTTWNSSGQYLNSIDYGFFKESGFGTTEFFVHFYTDSSNLTVSNAVAVWSDQVTSSLNVNSPVNLQADTFNIQELTALEFGTTFVSHYPKIMTNNFGIYGLINTSDSYLAAAASVNNGTVLKIGNDTTTAIEMKVNGENLNPGGWIPFKYNLVDVINSLTEQVTPPVLFENIVGGNSSRTTNNIFTTGDSNEYEPTNIWMGGDSHPHQAPREGTDASNYVYMISMQTTLVATRISIEWIKFAELDECYSKYYLVWQTKSGAPVCYGFNGNTVVSKEYDNTYMTDMYKRDVLKLQNIKNNYTLRTGNIEKSVYTVMEDIYTSPWIILYNTTTDKSVYVKVTDTSFTRKNSIKEDKTPFRFEVNLQEIDNIEILH